MKLTFRVKIITNGKTITNTLMHSKRRFFLKLGTINWKKCPSVYIRVNYEKGKDNFGKSQIFHNDGFYTNKQDLLRAAYAFVET